MTTKGEVEESTPSPSLVAPMFGIHSSVGKSPSPKADEFAVQIITMNGSLYVWVGAGDSRAQRMDNLTAALTSRTSSLTKPSVATIFEGGVADDSCSFAEGMAERLCKRTGQVVFVSYNLPVTSTPDEALLFEVEKVTIDLLKNVTAGTKVEADNAH